MSKHDSLVSYASDVVALTRDSLTGECSVLLIQRGGDSSAYPGAWALPGGYVDEDETARFAAARELEEETGLTVPAMLLMPLGVYDMPRRDPRGRVVSAAYTTWLETAYAVRGGDDAQAAKWLPTAELKDLDLAFDHAIIIKDALTRHGLSYLVTF